jgi:hypothetical protein
MILGNANGINLNNDSPYQISRVGGLGVIMATRIVQNRPFRKWSDLEKVEGFDKALINDLRGAGAILGRPRKPKADALPRSDARPPTTRRLRTKELRKPKRRTSRRLATNIFSGEGDRR